jgi:hypothetical protein
VIGPMDGDGRDSADDVPRLLELAWGGGEPSPLVAGIRTRRQDSWSPGGFSTVALAIQM